MIYFSPIALETAKKSCFVMILSIIKAALAVIKKALKDDGVFVIIDHSAKLGSGYQAANTLHRIDPNIVKFQLEEAGFELIEEANYLRNPNDDLTTNVFAPGTRG